MQNYKEAQCLTTDTATGSVVFPCDDIAFEIRGLCSVDARCSIPIANNILIHKSTTNEIYLDHIPSPQFFGIPCRLINFVTGV